MGEENTRDRISHQTDFQSCMFQLRFLPIAIGIAFDLIRRFNPPLTLRIWVWHLSFVYLHELKIRRLRYEFSFSETKNKNRKKIYTENGNVYRQCGLHTKDFFKRPI